MIIVIGCHTIKGKHKKQNAVEKLQSHPPVEVKLSHTKASYFREALAVSWKSSPVTSKVTPAQLI